LTVQPAPRSFILQIALAHDKNARNYFNFTESKAKIAQIPMVMRNCTTAASRIAPPHGSAQVRTSMATAVSTPRINLLIQFT
jgi:hypothetical protein